jgi:O-antigen/teichoic acid export membrane protein
LLGIALAWLGFGLDGIVFGLVLAGIIGYFISVRGLRFLTHQGKDNSAALSETTQEPFDFSSVRGYVATAFIGTLGLVALGNIDIVLAKHSLAPEVAGAYGALAVVAKVIFFVTGVIASVLFAMSSESVEKNKDQPRNFSVFWMALLLTIIAASVAIIIYFLVPNFVMSVFFGDKYLAVAPMLGWFGLAAGLYAVVNLMLQQLLSMRVILAAQWLLGIVIIESLGLFFFGSSIASIIGIVIGAQVLALISGLVFIWKTCRIQK